MQEDNIEYSGRPGEYRPETGSVVNSPVTDTGIDTNHYADLDYLQNQLAMIVNESRQLMQAAEASLETRAIVVASDDERLYEANLAEWPSTLGDPRNKISYRYYKALRVRDTTSASYIRKRYEEAARDVAGSNAIDIISLAEIINDEAQLVQGFLNDYVGNVDDAAEFRTLELFQDWTVTALAHTRKLRSLFEKGNAARSIHSAGLGVNTAEEAKQSQAVFKLKLNTTNDVIVKDIDYVRKNFSEFASVFYTKFLGPALQFRLEVGRKTFPLGSEVAAEVDRAATNLDVNLENVLADQQRRNQIFNRKIEKLTEDIVNRDQYRSNIHQLAPLGKQVPQTLVATQDTEEEVEYFHSVEPEARPASAIFTSPHSALGSLDEDDHPQYFKKSGGTLTGHMNLAEDVLVDGMSPSTHHHTGQDGTEQIHAGDLLPGSLRTDAIDTSEIPVRPTQLRVLNQDIEIVPPGVAQLNVQIQWIGTNPNDLYEVEYVPITGGGPIKLPPIPGNEAHAYTIEGFDPNSSWWALIVFKPDFSSEDDSRAVISLGGNTIHMGGSEVKLYGPAGALVQTLVVDENFAWVAGDEIRIRMFNTHDSDWFSWEGRGFVLTNASLYPDGAMNGVSSSQDGSDVFGSETPAWTFAAGSELVAVHIDHGDYNYAQWVAHYLFMTGEYNDPPDPAGAEYIADLTTGVAQYLDGEWTVL